MLLWQLDGLMNVKKLSGKDTQSYVNYGFGRTLNVYCCPVIAGHYKINALRGSVFAVYRINDSFRLLHKTWGKEIYGHCT